MHEKARQEQRDLAPPAARQARRPRPWTCGALGGSAGLVASLLVAMSCSIESEIMGRWAARSRVGAGMEVVNRRRLDGRQVPASWTGRPSNGRASIEHLPCSSRSRWWHCSPPRWTHPRAGTACRRSRSSGRGLSPDPPTATLLPGRQTCSAFSAPLERPLPSFASSKTAGRPTRASLCVTRWESNACASIRAPTATRPRRCAS